MNKSPSKEYILAEKHKKEKQLAKNVDHLS